MLDNETKTRIDTARDILVGKVPVPQSQVEQITIALIYKFMDDMDREVKELGGKPSFFKGEFSRYNWSSIFSPSVSGHELVKLYGEALEKMNHNPNIPQLFRDIFKNAYLPYRDPETLKSFLKIINEFHYSHSEKLGDAFEYLLSILGSQGDAGQFRTPRHIIDFIVEVVSPSKTDKILDPACGTAGFLISAYKHIMKNNMKKVPGDTLKPEEKNTLIKNFCGYDISPDMVRLSLVNLYLHGFSEPKIFEYDTLTSDDRWNEYYDVILANPPFMSPKGGIKPHKRFSSQAKRSEVLFVDYICEHLTPNGKAGIIVPEGIIFQSGTAYKQLRKMLVEKYLWAVVSLPAGVFNPYAGVKTSILLLDKNLSKKTDKILFVKIENDGFDLGAQRREINKNDLPDAIRILSEYKNIPSAFVIPTETGIQINGNNIMMVEKIDIRKKDEYNLSVDRYRMNLNNTSGNFKMVQLGNQELFSVESGGTPDTKNEAYWDGDVNWVTLEDLPKCDIVTKIKKTKRKITELGLKKSAAKLIPSNSVIVSSRATIGRIGINKIELATNQGFKNILIKDETKIIPEFLAYMMTRLKGEMNNMASGGTFNEISKTNFCTLKIPLPPLSVQQEIVNKIEGYQKIIDGARQIVENYRPHVDISPDWEMVELGQIFKLSSGNSLTQKDIIAGDFPVYGGNGIVGYHNKYFINEPTIVIGRVGAYCGSIYIAQPKSWVTDNGLYVVQYFRKINQEYLSYILKSINLNKYAKVGGQPSISQNTVYEISIPIPSLEEQQQIVSQIEREQKLIDTNKELIKLFEQKCYFEINRICDK